MNYVIISHCNVIFIVFSFLTFVKQSFNQNFEIMGNLLYGIAVVLIIVWAIAFFGYAIGGLIHLLVIIAIVAIILRVIQGNNKPIV
jgi:hypothetical protein